MTKSQVESTLHETNLCKELDRFHSLLESLSGHKYKLPPVPPLIPANIPVHHWPWPPGPPWPPNALAHLRQILPELHASINNIQAQLDQVQAQASQVHLAK